jgi:hypothetical protein
MANSALQPVTVVGRADGRLSRWLWLVKWLLLVPHIVVLVFLWLAVAVVSVVAWFAILIRARYPRAIFNFTLGVLRWSWRVLFYGYAALGTDRYPPFSLGAHADYPAYLDIAYPERLSRGLALVKSWLLAIPHYLVLGFFLGMDVGSGDRHTGWPASAGLVSVLVLFVGVLLLFAGRYPPAIFAFVMGMDRWAVRVAAYVLLMTDVYPPFRLDQGGREPISAEVRP